MDQHFILCGLGRVGERVLEYLRAAGARLGSAVANIQTLSVSGLAAPLLALVARTGEALSTFRLEDGSTRQIAEFTVAPQSSLVNRRIGDEARHHQAAVVTHTPRGETPR